MIWLTNTKNLGIPSSIEYEFSSSFHRICTRKYPINFLYFLLQTTILYNWVVCCWFFYLQIQLYFGSNIFRFRRIFLEYLIHPRGLKPKYFPFSLLCLQKILLISTFSKSTKWFCARWTMLKDEFGDQLSKWPCEFAAKIIWFDAFGLFLMGLCKIVNVCWQTEHDCSLTGGIQAKKL